MLRPSKEILRELKLKRFRQLRKSLGLPEGVTYLCTEYQGIVTHYELFLKPVYEGTEVIGFVKDVMIEIERLN